MNLIELFNKLKKENNIEVWENDEDRKTIEIYKDDKSILICCVYNVENIKDYNLFRMDFSQHHDRWVNCDYEEYINSNNVDKVYNNILYWLKHINDVDRIYNDYEDQEYCLNVYMKKIFED